MKVVAAVAALFVTAAAFAANDHPANARAAAACSTLFFDDGDFDEAKFFAKLAREEAFVPEAHLANARLEMHEGHWAYASLFRHEFTHDPSSGAVLLRGAADLARHGRLADAAAAVGAAVEADPSLERVATQWLLFVKRSFPAASIATPLPPPTRPADADQREAQCRALAPPLFPEPFDAHGIGRETEERIWQQGEKAITDTSPPCVHNSSFEIVVGSDGHVESVTMRHASFKAGGANDPAAIAAEQQNMVPMLLKQKYKPGRIQGVPVRTITRAGVQRNCE
jgi:hypothetical protein